jgi:hypothetical protein
MDRMIDIAVTAPMLQRLVPTTGSGSRIELLHYGNIMQSVFSVAARRTIFAERFCVGRGRAGALKTSWTKPQRVGGRYGDRMTAALAS